MLNLEMGIWITDMGKTHIRIEIDRYKYMSMKSTMGMLKLIVVGTQVGNSSWGAIYYRRSAIIITI